jgi:hypothetical protein
MSATETDFEFELRALPGVLSVGIERDPAGEVDSVTLLVNANGEQAVQGAALTITSLYYPDASVTVVGTNRAQRRPADTGRPGRVAMIGASSGDDGAITVNLRLRGEGSSGTSMNGPLIGGAEATLEALRGLACHIPFYLKSVSKIASAIDAPVVVVLRSVVDTTERLGVAQSDDDLTAAVRATLNALNRHIERVSPTE